MIHRASLLTRAAALALSAAACGGGAAPTPSPCVSVSVKEWSFEPSPFDVRGAFCVDLKNDGGLSHDLSVRRSGGPPDPANQLFATKLLRPAEATSLKWDLPAGEYTVYCDVAGHEAAGLKTTLVVR